MLVVVVVVAVSFQHVQELEDEVQVHPVIGGHAAPSSWWWWCRRGMHEHQVRDTQVQERELRRYVQEAAGSQSSADQLAKLADLRDRGVITAEEFDREKAKILA